MKIQIEHEIDAKRFTAQIGDNSEAAILTYRLNDKLQVDFNYSYVPVSYRGQGLAKQLVDAGFSWARDQNLQIFASCSYVAQFI